MNIFKTCNAVLSLFTVTHACSFRRNCRFEKQNIMLSSLILILQSVEVKKTFRAQTVINQNQEPEK